MTTTSLPFFAYDSTGRVIDTWNVTATGNWDKDNATGRAYYAMVADQPMLLLRVLQGVVKRGCDTGVETGFLSAVAGM